MDIYRIGMTGYNDNIYNQDQEFPYPDNNFVAQDVNVTRTPATPEQDNTQ